ncbi:SDR family oxidoreductase [Kineosporia sp. J2-2]|uniref:SDR family oxidoreductase n=1 Tax=Kineosporia corallincola TaxID=2835133 RepID=A0ABS5TEX8_9ACTN|nr:SDR family oxidoreductase [Kineosporia corallincola]MBT0769635.1 SDR family oxidoreductase [Kineosporia corallincola]
MSIQNRPVGTVFVSGGAGGLGAAVVAAVREAGGTPAVIDLVAPKDDVVAHAVADLSDTTEAENAVAALIGKVGPPDAVVTCAGTDACGPLDGVDSQTWERVVRVNLFGTVALVRACLPHLKQNHGTVVTVASTLGIKAVGDATAYCASKFGVVGFTRSLAAELAGQVGVTLLIPGGMSTAFFDGRTEQYRPGPDAVLNDPAHTAQAVLTVLSQPPGSEIRELVVATSTEPSWP